jgi:hypothetical protein
VKVKVKGRSVTGRGRWMKRRGSRRTARRECGRTGPGRRSNEASRPMSYLPQPPRARGKRSNRPATNSGTRAVLQQPPHRPPARWGGMCAVELFCSLENSFQGSKVPKQKRNTKFRFRYEIASSGPHNGSRQVRARPTKLVIGPIKNRWGWSKHTDLVTNIMLHVASFSGTKVGVGPVCIGRAPPWTRRRQTPRGAAIAPRLRRQPARRPLR